MEPKKRILIAYTTAGAGHMKAGTAVYEAFKKIDGNIDLKAVDLLEYSTPFMKSAYPAVYLFMINRAHLLWGFFYYLTDFRPFYLLLRFVLSLTNKIHCKSFEKLILDYKPSVVISTHFETSRITGDLIKSNRFNGKLINVLTDYGPHSFWIVDGVDKYIVGSDRAKRELIRKWKVREDKIEILGIPVNPVFSQTPDKDALLSALGLQKGLSTILIVSGGFGVGPIEELVTELKDVKGLQLIVVCGKNPDLFKKINSMKIGVPSKIYGFSDNMHELMSVSDLIISKPGGISTAETLAKGLPMIIISPVPGQETRNCRLLLENRAAIKINGPKSARAAVKEFMDNPARISELKDNAKNIARPNSAMDIARLGLSL